MIGISKYPGSSNGITFEGKSYDYQGYCKAKQHRNNVMLDSLQIVSLSSATPKTKKRPPPDFLKDLPRRVNPKRSLHASVTPDAPDSKIGAGKPVSCVDLTDAGSLDVEGNERPKESPELSSKKDSWNDSFGGKNNREVEMPVPLEHVDVDDSSVGSNTSDVSSAKSSHASDTSSVKSNNTSDLSLAKSSNTSDDSSVESNNSDVSSVERDTTNNDKLIGKEVRLIGGKYLGKIGKVIGDSEAKVFVYIFGVGKVHIIKENIRLAEDRLDSENLIGKKVLIVGGTYLAKRGIVSKLLKQTARVDIRGVTGYKCIKWEFLTLAPKRKTSKEGAIVGGKKMDGTEQETKRGMKLKESGMVSHEKSITDGKKRDKMGHEVRNGGVNKNNCRIMSPLVNISDGKGSTLEVRKACVENSEIAIISPANNNPDGKRRSGMELEVNNGCTMTNKRSTVPITYMHQCVKKSDILKIGMHVHIIRGTLRKHAGHIASLDQKSVVLRFDGDLDLVRVNKWDVLEIY